MVLEGLQEILVTWEVTVSEESEVRPVHRERMADTASAREGEEVCTYFFFNFC